MTPSNCPKCSECDGIGFNDDISCYHCSGTGYEPPKQESPRAEGPYRADFKKLPSENIEGPCLFGPDGDLYFETIGDASKAAVECNEAYRQGQLSNERYKGMWEALWFGLETDWHDTYSKDWLIRRKKELEERQ